jgi:hypothetical protein
MRAMSLLSRSDYPRRLAALRRLEEECECDPDVIRQKRDQLIQEYQAELGPALCPLCDASLLQTAQRASLRSCVRHNLTVIELRGALPVTADGNVPTPSPAMPWTMAMPQPTEPPARNSGSSKTNAMRWTVGSPGTKQPPSPTSTASAPRKAGDDLLGRFRQLAELLEQQEEFDEEMWQTFDRKLNELSDAWRRQTHTEPPAFVVDANWRYRIEIGEEA